MELHGELLKLRRGDDSAYHARGFGMVLENVNRLPANPAKLRGLPARQVVKYAPWIIAKADLLSATVQEQVKAARRGCHRLPQILLGQGQLSLE